MNESEANESLQAICNVSSSRASELLEAADGSIERAVEIHLSHESTATETASCQLQDRPTISMAEFPAETVSRKISSPPNKLDAFFSPRKKRNKTTEPGDEKGLTSVQEDKFFLQTPTNKHKSADNPVQAAFKASPVQSTNVEKVDDDPLSFAMLAKALAEISGTAKRTIKLNVLVELFGRIIRSVGGIHDKTSRDHDALILTRAMDLILGKLSSSTDVSTTVLQVSSSAVSTAIQTVTGISRKELGAAYRRDGDLGDVAANGFVSTRQRQFFTTVKPRAGLSILQVHQQLQAIADVSIGKGSQKERQSLMIKLLQRGRGKDELRFLVRMLLGNMRIGATIKTVLAALATATEQVQRETFEGYVSSPDPAKVLEKVFNVCPRMEKINTALLTGGIAYARMTCSVEIGFPIQPMLANPVHSFAEIQSFMTTQDGMSMPVVAEYKYDGVRCQAHWDGQRMNLFSRNMLENTQQYPDVVEYMVQAMGDGVTSCIIDAEIVGVVADSTCSDGYRLLPFQDLSTRRGIKDANDTSRIAVCVFAFDLMSINGRSLLDASLGDRQSLLRQHFTATEGFRFAQSTIFNEYADLEVQAALQKAIDVGAEGLMLKLIGNDAIRSIYDSGARSQLWKKVKKDYVGGFADTIDVVPIGAWFGTGRKAQKGFLSPVLFAIYDDDEGVYRSISRCMSFSDAMYDAMREFYFRGVPYPADVGIEASAPLDKAQDENALEIDAENEIDNGVEGNNLSITNDSAVDGRVNCFDGRPPPYIVSTNESPPIWFKPSEVFEVSFADLTLSRAHTAAIGLIDDEQGRGVALRFPRFVRRRPDKGVDQATASTEIAYLFARQSKH
jgi:DNA ligase-1